MIHWCDVVCCEKVANYKLIFYSYTDKKFYFSNFISYSDFDQSIQCCPWCGVCLTESHLRK